MSQVKKSIMTQEGFIVNYKENITPRVVMRLVLDSNGNVKPYTSTTTGEVKALIVNQGGDIYAYLREQDLDNLTFDENGFVEIHPNVFPEKVKATKKFSMPKHIEESEED